MVEYSCEKCGKTFKQKGHYKKQLEKKYMLTIPSQINNFNIDGFFAAYIKKR